MRGFSRNTKATMRILPRKSTCPSTSQTDLHLPPSSRSKWSVSIPDGSGLGVSPEASPPRTLAPPQVSATCWRPSPCAPSAPSRSWWRWMPFGARARGPGLTLLHLSLCEERDGPGSTPYWGATMTIDHDQRILTTSNDPPWTPLP